jgi:lipoic acid synthetase
VAETKPDWLKIRAPNGTAFEAVRDLVRSQGMHTVCDAARCPNLSECWSHGTATFMILGDRCTRSCRFCAVDHGDPAPVDPYEPERVAQAASHLRLRHVVVTSVTRDDLPDQGAGQFSRTIAAIRSACPDAKVEVLVPDMQADEAALSAVAEAGPDIIAHNLEVVRRLQPVARDPMADYDRSLRVLARYQELGATRTKSSLMLGLGESRAEVREAMRDLREVGVTVLTLGQYLRPRGCDLEVVRYVPPLEFEELKGEAMALGFVCVASGPLVRSSYRAFEVFS